MEMVEQKGMRRKKAQVSKGRRRGCHLYIGEEEGSP
jgi:hypothetical protein